MPTMKREFTTEITPQRREGRSVAQPQPDCAKRLECVELAPAFEPPPPYDSASKLLHLTRIRRTRPTGEWFSLSSFGGEGWGEEAHHHSRCCGSWLHSSGLPHQYVACWLRTTTSSPCPSPPKEERETVPRPASIEMCVR